MDGGNIYGDNIKTTALHPIRIISNYRNTRNSTKTHKNTHTTRKNKQKKLSEISEIDHFRARMNMPIGTTSFGISLTPEMIATNEIIRKEINERSKNDYYKNWGLYRK